MPKTDELQVCKSKSSSPRRRRLLLTVCVWMLAMQPACLAQAPIWDNMDETVKPVNAATEKSIASQVPPYNANPTDKPDRPKFGIDYIRYDEDWTSLKDPNKRIEVLDRLKHLSLTSAGSAYLSLGGEARQVYEFYNNQYWGRGPQDGDGWFLQRYLLHADLHLGEQWRMFGQLQSALENGRKGGPRPYDKDKLDLHQAFVDYRPLGKNAFVTFRLGRQEMFYGSGRLIEAREGLNTRISFDGVKALAQFKHIKLDGFALRPTLQKAGWFDDSPDSKRMFWGLYGTLSTGEVREFDVYYLGLDQKLATFNKGTGRQVRQTFGGRFSGHAGRFDFDDEVVGQVGTFASGGIRAWGVALEHGFTLASVRTQPRIGLRSDVASGDSKPQGKTLGTFSALFPKGKYFGEADLNGPSNSIDLIPTLTSHPTRKVQLTVSYGAFWRETTHDGIYGFATNLEKSGYFSESRYVGQQVESDIDYTLNVHAVIRTVYQHFFSGTFIKQTPPGRDVNYVTVWFDYHF